MDGFMEFVGVRVVEQLGDDWARAGRKKEPSKAAKKTSDIPKKADLVYQGLLYSNRTKKKDSTEIPESRMTIHALESGHGKALIQGTL